MRGLAVAVCQTAGSHDFWQFSVQGEADRRLLASEAWESAQQLLAALPARNGWQQTCAAALAPVLGDEQKEDGIGMKKENRIALKGTLTVD